MASRTLRVRITGDSDSLNRALGRSESRMRKFGRLAGQALLAAGAAGAAFAVKAIDSASDLAESQSKVAQVFRDSAPVVVAFAKTAAQSIGQSEQQALEATGTFGNLFTSMGLGRKAAADLSIDVVTLASDLASFNNIGTDEALEKLRAGLVGEVEPLRSVGVNLNAAAVEAKALELGLVDASGAVTDAGKVQARYALILEQTKNAQGDFARTSDGLANQQRILQAEVSNLTAELGTSLLPIALKLVKFLNQTAIPAFKDFTAVVTGNSAKISTEVARHLGVKVPDTLSASGKEWARYERLVAEKTRDGVQSFADLSRLIQSESLTFGEKFGIIWRDIWSENTATEQRNLDIMRKMLLGQWFPGALEGTREFGRRFREAFSNAFRSVRERLSSWGSNVVEFFRNLPDRVVSALSGMGDKLKKAFEGALSKIKLSLPFSFNAQGDGPGRGGGGPALARSRSLAAGLPISISSTYRSPAHNARVGGSPTSYHLDRGNPAVDWVGPAWALDTFAARLRSAGGWRELLWRTAGHYDHLHVAHKGGRVDESWPTLPGLAADERPAILQVGETINPRGGAGVHVTVMIDGQEIRKALRIDRQSARAA